MRFDQGSLRALTQRFGADCHHRRLHRFRPAPQPDQLVAQRLERVQQPLADTLPLDQHPVVVPAGQQVEGVNSPGQNSQIMLGCSLCQQASSP